MFKSMFNVIYDIYLLDRTYNKITQYNQPCVLFTEVINERL